MTEKLEIAQVVVKDGYKSFCIFGIPTWRINFPNLPEIENRLDSMVNEVNEMLSGYLVLKSDYDKLKNVAVKDLEKK